MRTPLIAGNWKMNKTVREAVDLARALVPLLRDVPGVEVAVVPPFTALAAVGETIRGTTVRLGAQNMHWEDQGAYTGEISGAMLTDLDVSFVILGHSERRQLFGETDQGVATKAKKALDLRLTPIICVGETLDEREADCAFQVVERQVRGGLSLLGPASVGGIVLAYEPVWAIGTGRTATVAQAQEMHVHIRSILGALAGAEQAGLTRILYGGSVKPSNIAELMAAPDVDGALVGGASLEAETFASIVGFRV
jgi:triosephosphate isomerase